MLIRLFQRALQTRPILTQIVASGAICGGGDAFTQLVIDKKHIKDFDYIRSGRFFVLASAFIAPCLIKWFKVLERVRGNSRIVPLIRVACDQLLFAPGFNAMILFNLRVLEGFTFDTSWKMMKEDWWTIYSNKL
ncbi:unnamed protein product [Cylicocyclus nassatus]|uniref:Mitochondrial inner membrane protein Mpv17 n=1 Tax=Cylicocyclus nassatus TaxID=53992 RepID=A0AA36H097_CYLNA|nr:unnamed protein product [Cylicocyclus nassatus]